jgi:hypothetical protein
MAQIHEEKLAFEEWFQCCLEILQYGFDDKSFHRTIKIKTKVHQSKPIPDATHDCQVFQTKMAYTNQTKTFV